MITFFNIGNDLYQVLITHIDQCLLLKGSSPNTIEASIDKQKYYVSMLTFFGRRMIILSFLAVTSAFLELTLGGRGIVLLKLLEDICF